MTHVQGILPDVEVMVYPSEHTDAHTHTHTHMTAII